MAPIIARIILIDPKSLVGNGDRKTVTAALNKDLNAIKSPNFGADYLAKTLNIRFETSFQSAMPTVAQRGAFGRLDFPIYIFRAHTSDFTPNSDILGLMRNHRIRDSGRAATLYKEAEAGWDAPSVEGIGVSPLEGFRKVGFVKADKIEKDAPDFARGYINVIEHEVGHMCNITNHSASGLMQSSVPLSGVFDYADSDKTTILAKLGQLKTVSEAALDRLYEQAN